MGSEWYTGLRTWQRVGVDDVFNHSTPRPECLLHRESLRQAGLALRMGIAYRKRLYKAWG